MDKSSKLLLMTFASVVLFTILATYYKYVYLKDYEVYSTEEAVEEIEE